MQLEAQHQAALFEWAAVMAKQYPELELLYHVANGGSRNKIEAANLKKQGVKSGVPDICLPVARGIFHGLYIELKVGKNTATDNQQRWMIKLIEQDYCARVCYGWDEARDLIMRYITIGKTAHCADCSNWKTHLCEKNGGKWTDKNDFCERWEKR